MTDQEPIEDLLDQVADHADRVAEGDRLGDQDSMRTALAIAALKATDWANEYEAVKPAKPDALGVTKADSDRRFVEWLAWREEKNGRRALQGRYVNYLTTASQIATRVHAVHTATEWTVRPLRWFLGTVHEHRMAEVWAAAVELAQAEGVPIDQSHVRHAVAEFKKTLGRKDTHAVVRTKKASQDRGRAMAYVRQLWADGDPDEQRKFDDWYKQFRKGAAV